MKNIRTVKSVIFRRSLVVALVALAAVSSFLGFTQSNAVASFIPDNGTALMSGISGGPFSEGSGSDFAQSSVGPDLYIQKSDSSDPATVGEELTYTLMVENMGSSTSTAPTIIDSLPKDADFVSASTGCAYNSSGHKVVCVLGDLSSGSNATSTVVVLPKKAGNMVNVAMVMSGEADLDPTNNIDVETTEVITPSDDGGDDDVDDSNVIDGFVNQNLDLKNRDYTITGTVNGNVQINNGTLTITGEVNGNVEQKGPGSLIVDGGIIHGNAEEKGPGDVRVTNGAIVNGNVEEKGSGSLSVSGAGSTIGGNATEKS